jgi:uncharacterized membrane protein
MPDPVDPQLPPASEPSPTAPGTTSPAPTALPSNIAAALACIPLVGGLIFYVIEKHDQFVRFYAMQSIIFGGAWFLFNIVSWIIQNVFWAIPLLKHVLVPLWVFVAALIHLGFLVIMIIAMVKAFSGVRWDIPFVGPIARKQMGEAD